MKKYLTVLTATIGLALHAAVPIAWTNSPGMAPRVLPPVPHGSTIDFTIVLKGYSDPPFSVGADVRMYFQTNG